MNSLPCGDRTTVRSELAVFATLGLAAVAMVAMAVAQMTGFEFGSRRPAAGLAGRPVPAVVAGQAAKNLTLTTNVNFPADARGASRDLATGKRRSAGDSAMRLLLR